MSKDTLFQTQTLGVAIIGSGLMAKAHTMAWRNVQAVYGDVPVTPRLVILCDATDEIAAAGAVQFGYERWTTSWREAIDDPDVNVVDIVTPNFLHKDIAIAAAKAGKHIWCEKPLALTAEDALEMTQAAEDAEVRTLVGFSYLRNPGLALAKRLIESGQIGDMVSFTAAFALDAMVDPLTPFTWRQDRGLAGTGALGDLGAHVIAIARFLIGDIAKVASMARIVTKERPLPQGSFGYGEKAAASAPKCFVENDDVTYFLAEFANGAIGSIEASRVSAVRAWDLSFMLTGSKGAIRFDQQHMYKLEVSLDSDPHEIHGFRTIELGPGHGDFGVLWPVPGANISIHDLKFFEVHDLIAGIVSGKPVWPDFREGYEVQKVIDAVDRASKEGSWVVVSGDGSGAFNTIHDQGSEVDFSGTKRLARKIS
jgi:predicted dehydrogenase